MQRLVFAIALTVAVFIHHVAHADTDVPVECFSSPEAVHDAYPASHAVYTTHATWWTESSKCWFVGTPVVSTEKSPRAKPKAKPRAVASAPPLQRMAQVLPPQPKPEMMPAMPAPSEVQEKYEEMSAPLGTYEENAAALRALMFGPDESPTDFEGRFSVVGYAGNNAHM
jgi:hypothetical protein